MEESKQENQLFLQMQHQQQLQQQRQQQYLLMQQLQRQRQQQQQQSAMFPTNLRPPGLIQNRPVNPFLQNATMSQQQQQQMMMMRKQQQQLEQQKSNQVELQFAYQDAWRVCHPDFKRPFESLEDACERLLPYHVVADYEAEEDDRILESDTTSQVLPRCQLWDNNIAAKVAEFSATFEKQVQGFNMITQKTKDGELRVEERLAIERALLEDERRAYVELKSEMDREMKAREARLRMAAMAQAAGQVKAESQLGLMARNPLRANAIGNYGEQGQNVNPNEMMMMMMNGWGNNNNQREEREPLEDFLNDEENENGGNGGVFDLNLR